MRVAEDVRDLAEHAEGEGEVRHVSGPVPVGERETTPAPPSLGGDDDPLAFADVTPLRLQTPSFARTSSAVAFRTMATVPTDLDVRLAFVLLHVDGTSSLEDIAQLTALATEEVQARFLELLAMGLVDMRSR